MFSVDTRLDNTSMLIAVSLRLGVFGSHCQSFSSHVSSHYSAVGQLVVSTKLKVYSRSQDSKIELEMLCNGTMSEFISEKVVYCNQLLLIL